MALTVGTNSYISIEDATNYLNDRLYSDAWTNATDSDKARSLIQATKTIDRQPFRGTKVTTDQVLQFPRALPVDDTFYRVSERSFNVYTGWVAQTEVPQQVKDATCEEALALLDRGNSTRLQLQREGVKSASIGNTSESYSGTISKLKSPEAKELLQPYLGSVIIS